MHVQGFGVGDFNEILRRNTVLNIIIIILCLNTYTYKVAYKWYYFSIIVDCCVIFRNYKDKSNIPRKRTSKAV